MLIVTGTLEDLQYLVMGRFAGVQNYGVLADPVSEVVTIGYNKFLGFNQNLAASCLWQTSRADMRCWNSSLVTHGSYR